MRRIVFVPLAAALLFASASSASLNLQPIRRSAGEQQTLPRVRAGTVKIPAGHARGRVTVLVSLQLPPLAARNAALFAYSGTQRRLRVGSADSRSYLARLAREQRTAVTQLRRAIPQARVHERYRVILDGFAVTLPARKLPALVRLGFVRKVYPSLRYTLKLNKSPSIINVPAFTAATGARGEGVKIAVVDDGVDPANPFFNADGFAYPAGFPKGARAYTTPKVIVARAFPGPGSGRQGRLPLVRSASFHGTHVAGIAAGDSGTTAVRGPDHPETPGLSGVAPRAQIGNYRVFNAPTGIGYDAFTPEIVAAFEAAVADGMDVINFSGGGPQPDPQNDAFNEAVRNVVNAGVVPVIAAGNDRDEFGLGSVGTPGTAPDSIAVAAVSNLHVFGPALTVQTADAPPELKQIPLVATVEIPGTWIGGEIPLADVGSLVGTQGLPVERHLCGSTDDPNGPGGNVPQRGSLSGAVALAFRGNCSFLSKAVRAFEAGAVGMILVDNRPGEANGIALRLIDFPMAMVSDLDGARLRDYLAAHGGRAPVRVSEDTREIETGRSGIITSFSSAGPTNFGHLLKPDVAAPGGQILSSTTPEFASSPFAVFDGTSMATPHVSGAAALLIQRHRDWTPRQVKSALMSTAGPAWGNSERTQEASVLFEGAGLVNLVAADDPRIFVDQPSISFGDLKTTGGPAARARVVTIADAGFGAGTWTVELQTQSASAGASLELPPSVTVLPGGSAQLVVTARANAGAPTGENYGFFVLRHDADVRRIPYLFFVTRPALEPLPEKALQRLQVGSTALGDSHVDAYRFPNAAFGPPPTYFGPTMHENGAEQVYVTHVNFPVANIGVAVIDASLGALIEPWFLGSKDENDVQGYPGTPISVNSLGLDFRVDVGAAGSVFPHVGRYYVSVDSGSDPFTARPLRGSYVLRSWINDVTPPRIRLLTTRVTAGRPLLAAIVTDRGAGVDPFSLVIAYNRVLLGAAAYDPYTGLALFPIPREAPRLGRGRTSAIVVASDYQEAKNIDQASDDVLPNTQFRRLRIRGVARPTVAWLVPRAGSCVERRETLAVAASAPRRIRAVQFFDGRRRVATATRPVGGTGLYAADWGTGRAKRGRHVLRAVVVQRGGGKASAKRVVRKCSSRTR